eukprot:TRINITY_DN17153_c0_g1_i2.p1 TRINITY_DN17153_c0_g1~~TRINITY_DN17153_c0_g1_i2.p1  ORF type:complete len:399 (-),score=37.83 TRINITY_DN17153_c0_g1_i2:326-1522(-)
MVVGFLVFSSGILAAFAKFETWTLTLLEEEAKRGAVCLDGSASGYYLQDGTGSGKNKWLVHFQGGGWCTSLEDCVERSRGELGSSKSYASDKEFVLDRFDGGAHGLFSNDSTVNPDFHNWNKVFARYCDGGSRAGNVPGPVKVGNSTIFFRGGLILDALLDDLLRRGLSEASDAIVGGCSAGGLTVWLHLDYIRSRIPDSVRVVGVPQCGYFMDLPEYDGKPSYTPKYRAVYELMGVNTSRTMNQECKERHNEDQWRCFMAQYAMPFVKTPFFAVNSFYDSWQWSYILDVPSSCNARNFANCTSQERGAAYALRDSMLSNLSTVPKHSGYFAYSCLQHCGYLNHDALWSRLTSQGKSLRSAFHDWYFNGSQVRIAAHEEDPNANPTCGFYDAWQTLFV